MSRRPFEATKAWVVAISKGDMTWLKDTTIVAADCFTPPSNYQPHTWERIAVPRVNPSHGSGPIYKRVPGRSVDTKYNMVVAELKSQGADGRKRARTINYKSVYGSDTFDPKYKNAAANIKQEIATARDQVKTAYKKIAKDNQVLRKNARPTKKPTYDPTRLVFAPRKRRNTRLPITPPTWEKMIAECQPLIVFETNTAKIDETAKAALKANFFEQVAAANRRRSRNRQKKQCRRRRAKFVPTKLATISEEYKEPSGVPVRYQPMYKAPNQRWAAAADKYFTMSATSAGVVRDDGEGDRTPVVITNHSGHFSVPSSISSSPSTGNTPAKRAAVGSVEVTNKSGCFRVPSSSLSSGSSTTTDGDRKRRAEDDDLDQRAPARRRLSQPAADPAAVAVFNQPTQVHVEPEHEIKRRISLDNARRSEKSVQREAFKRITTWIAATFSGRRRSFAEAMEGEQDGSEEPPRTRVRLTLDLDAGSNPDIFGQAATQEQELPPSTNPRRETKSAKLLNAQHTSTAQWETLSDVPTEFSAVRTALYPETASSRETTPDAPAPVPALNVAFKDYESIPNICDSIRNHLDMRAAIVFGKVDAVDEIAKATQRVVDEANREAKEKAKKADEGAKAAEDDKNDEDDKKDDNDKNDDGDSIASDDTQPFEDDSVYDRINTDRQSDKDEKSPIGDVEVDTSVPNSSATEPLMADSSVNNSPSHDSTVPGSPTSASPSAMETTLEPAHMSPGPDTAIPSIEQDVVEATTVEATTVQSAMVDAPNVGQPADRMTLDEAPIEQPSTMPQPVEAAEDADSNEDSQFEVLHNFIRRAQKKLKAALSRPPVSEPELLSEPKSPNDYSFAAPESPRKALTQKDSNMSPITGKTSMSGSPGKKRKLNEVEGSTLAKPDLDDNEPQPLRKRRRKGAEDDAPNEVLNPEMAHAGSLTQKGSFAGPRRSKRVAPPRAIVSYTGPSNFSFSLSGSHDADMPAVSTASLTQQKKERDFAAQTRANTRLNKGAALMPPARLAGLETFPCMSDPFMSPEEASGSKAPAPRKSVRWDETLVRYEGDDAGEPSSSSSSAAAPPASAAQPVLEQPPSPTGPAPSPRAAPAASSSSAAPPESERKKALRPRPSRLPAAVAKSPALAPATRSRAAAAPAPSRAVPTTPTRRSSAVGASLGTPAAKRRGSARK